MVTPCLSASPELECCQICSVENTGDIGAAAGTGTFEAGGSDGSDIAGGGTATGGGAGTGGGESGGAAGGESAVDPGS